MKKEKLKPDLRKIPLLFRAVEKDDNYPKVYFGFLISDDNYKFVSYSAHNKEGSHFIERVLQKNEFSFSKITADEFELNCRIAVSTMKNESFDKQLEFESSDFKAKFADKKLTEILGEL